MAETIATGGDGGAVPPITNLFVLMLENHSFDHIFAMSGIAGIKVAKPSDCNTYAGPDGKPITCCVQDGAPPSMSTDPGHEFPDVLMQLCSKTTCLADSAEAGCYKGGPYPEIDRSGFARSYATSRSEGTGVPAPERVGDIMACFHTGTQLPVIHQLAQEFAICDAWFSSLPGPTWPNRFFVHGASSSGMDRSPHQKEEVTWETTRGFTYANGSIFDALAGAGRQWRLYQDKDNQFSDCPSSWVQGGWISQVASLKGVSLFDIRSFTHFARDLQERDAAGRPAYLQYPYTFIEPNFGASFFSHQGANPGPRYKGGSSQHPEDDMVGGEGLIKAVYEAIRNSPVWESSLLVIVYDEHGGFYDSVAPGPAPSPDDLSLEGVRRLGLNEYGFDFKRYGVRVPAVIVSPLIPRSTVAHTVYDHSSILRTLGKWLGLDPLTCRDAQANHLLPLLSRATPRDDCPLRLVEPAAPRRAEPAAQDANGTQGTQDGPDADLPLAESGNMIGFLRVLLKAELELGAKDGTPADSILAAFKKITTHAHALAYVERMRAKLAQFTHPPLSKA